MQVIMGFNYLRLSKIDDFRLPILIWNELNETRGVDWNHISKAKGDAQISSTAKNLKDLKLSKLFKNTANKITGYLASKATSR